VLRGPRPAPGIAGLRAALEARRADRRGPPAAVLDRAEAVIGELEAAFAPLLRAMDGPPGDHGALLRAHLQTAEALAAGDGESGADRLWRGEDGEALADFVDDLLPAAALLERVGPGDYTALTETLMAGVTVRPKHGAHPRLAILGPLEARLQHADLIVLAGLNEGTWPPDPPDDPWMSRAMRKTFGLPAHERRIGLAAHDFAQALAAPEVVLLRAEKTGGQPAVPARWLERLAAVLERLGRENALPKRPKGADAGSDSGGGGPNPVLARMLARQRALDSHPRLPILAPPRPRPPVSMRPDKLSATRVELLIRDPYSIYAQYVLGLRPLEDLEAELGAAEKGSMIHAALDRFVREHPDAIPAEAEAILIAMGEEAFGAEALARPAVQAFWWPRYRRIARWFLEREARRRGKLAVSHTEIRGAIEFRAGSRTFTLSAEADRIDRLADGSYVILDYKTGTVPSKTDVAELKSPQLVLEAAILKQNGFPGLPPGPIAGLEYWKLSGGSPAGQVIAIDKIDPDALADEVLERLQALIAAYELETTPYPPVPRPELAPRFNDYAHLARTAEWSLGGGGEEGA
jgi:ATP-dependent helicase/nuclease subunit B